VCGNGFVEEDEECDDGNLDAGDGCDAGCKLEVELTTGIAGTVKYDGPVQANDRLYILVFDKEITDLANEGEPTGSMDFDKPKFPQAYGMDFDAGTYWVAAWLDLGGNNEFGMGAEDVSTIYPEPVVVEEGKVTSKVDLTLPMPEMYCGDELCNIGETCETCPGDCGECPVCGNGEVEEPEECDDGNIEPDDGCDENCMFEIQDDCGNGACDEGENPCTCEEDCLVGDGTCCEGSDCPQPECGPCCVVECVDYQCTEPIWLDDCCWNEKCEDGEDADSCPEDCFCGNGTCDAGETADDCPDDCQGQEDCVKEGLPLPDVDDECCPGSEVLNSNWIPEGGECNGTFCYAPVCANCGNGTCGPGENYCSCPDDCGDSQCVQEGGVAMTEMDIFDCCAGLEPVSFIDIEGCDQYVCAVP